MPRKFTPPPRGNGLQGEFNKRLGNRSKLSKSVKVSASDQAKLRTPTASAGAVGTRARVASGTSKVSAPILKQHKKQFGDSHSVAEFQKTMNNVVEDTMQTIQKKMATERAVMAAIENPPLVDQGGPGFFDRAVAAGRMIPGAGVLLGGAGNPVDELTEQAISAKEGTERGVTPWQGMMEDFSRSPAGRAGDIASRLMYGLQGGLNTALQEDYRLRDEGNQQSNPLRFIDDLAEGAWQGLSGKTKYGPGDTWQTMRQGSDIAGFEQMRDFEAGGSADWLNPFGELSGQDLMKHVDQGVGFLGEITMDPADWVGVGAIPVIKNTGAKMTESTAKASVRNLVDTVARDFYDQTISTSGGLRYKPSADALSTFATQAAEDVLENSILDVTGGTHAGWGKMGGEQYAQAASQRVTLKIREEIFRVFNNRIDRVVKDLRQGGTPSPASWRTHMAQSPEFDNVVREAWDQIENHPTHPRHYNDVDDFLADLKNHSGSAKLIENIANAERAKLDGALSQQVTDEIYRQTRQLSYNTVAVRVGGRKIPIKTFGRAYAALKKSYPNDFKIPMENFANAISYERNFPGRLSLVTQASRSIGADVFEQFHRKWRKIAKEYSKADANLLYKYLGDPASNPLPKRLEQVAIDLRNELDDMKKLEEVNGARPWDDAYADNYVPVFTKKEKFSTRKEFKDARKKYIKANGNAGPFTADGARRWGHKKLDLKPVDDIFEALLLRKMRSTRDIARATFYKDLIENYGSMGKNMSDFAKNKMGMTRADINHLPQYMRQQMLDDGVEFFLPRAHQEMFDTYSNLSKWDTELSGLLKGIQKVTNIIKYMSTVIRSGFHIRNMIGDLYMGLMDKVPIRAYGEVFQKYMRNLKGANVGFRIAPNITLSFDQVKTLFDEHVNSGFFETELPLGGSTPTAGQAFSNTRKNLAHGLRKGSDMREDYGRFVHFVTALRQEAAGHLKRGVTDQATLIRKATDSAVWRVNHYKFDYGALTAFERKVKLAFPFYTFTRKAMPTLVQQLFLNPKYIGLTNRFMEQNDGSAADAFNAFFLPDYVKDMGYGILNNEPEPLYITQDILPPSTLNSFDFTNVEQFAQSAAKQVNPIGAMPFELALGKRLFDQRSTGSFPEYISNRFTVPSQLIGDIDPRGNPDPLWQQILNEGFIGANIPVRRFTEAQQDQGLREAEDRFIQDPFKEFNKSQNRFRIYQSNRAEGTSFRIENVHTGEIVGEGTNPAQVLERAKRMSGG